MMTSLQQQLFALQDPEYKAFHSRLMPTVDPDRIIGIRTPALRQFAKAMARTPEAADFLDALPHTYYEENNLHGFLLETIKDYDQQIAYLDRFLPYVDNWATCDLMSMKLFRRHRTSLAKKIPEWLASDHVYTVRFGIKMLMDHFLDEAFDPAYPAMVAALHSEEYYVNMMAAWYFATALAKQPTAILPYLEESRLSVWVHNKSIQKAVESRRITPEQKEYLRGLKR